MNRYTSGQITHFVFVILGGLILVFNFTPGLQEWMGFPDLFAMLYVPLNFIVFPVLLVAWFLYSTIAFFVSGDRFTRILSATGFCLSLAFMLFHFFTGFGLLFV